MRYAAVRNGIVENIVECNGFTIQPLAKVMKCTLVPCERYAVQVGDTYQKDAFYRGEKKLVALPTANERMQQLEEENAQLKERLAATEQATLGLMSLMQEVG